MLRKAFWHKMSHLIFSLLSGELSVCPVLLLECVSWHVAPPAGNYILLEKSIKSSIGNVFTVKSSQFYLSGAKSKHELSNDTSNTEQSKSKHVVYRDPTIPLMSKHLATLAEKNFPPNNSNLEHIRSSWITWKLTLWMMGQQSTMSLLKYDHQVICRYEEEGF